ncbi:hypothetical protein H0X06_03760 [Candidatus Dependentiae bacterium]|nr:hypothetical protein [Candidatus Dependentiae bacterium]
MSLHPAFLFIGSEQACVQKAREILRNTLCKKQGCTECVDCSLIEEKKHYLLLWLTPDNYYTLSQIEVVFKVLAFALQPNEHFFIVFERADLFNQATANSLLKVLEEPPRGYHFILLAQRAEGILPTIWSRCLVEVLSYQESQDKHPLYRYFTSYTYKDAGDFTKELDRHKTLERDMSVLLDQLAAFWHQRMLLCYESGNEQESNTAYALESLVHEARRHAPLPGSAKIFLKNLYLSFFKLVANQST